MFMKSEIIVSYIQFIIRMNTQHMNAISLFPFEII